MMIEEMALVIAISGVCSEWLTFQITWKPTKTDSTKTMKCDRKLAGANMPTSSISTAPTPQATAIHRSRQLGWPAIIARPMPHQQGSSNSHVPIGRSARDRRSHGLQSGGA